jgi:hypothetical protein
MCNTGGRIHDTSEGRGCCCGCAGTGGYVSKKKRIGALKRHAADLEERAADIREYLRELEEGGPA